MSSTAALILEPPTSAPLGSTQPHLMPFHIAHTGPALIDSYFLVHPYTGESLSDASSSKPPTEPLPTTSIPRSEANDAGVQGKVESSKMDVDDQEKLAPAKYTAAFRGRVMHGLKVDLPNAYTGILIKKDGEDGPSASNMGPPPDSSGMRASSGGGGKRKAVSKGKASLGKRRMTRSRSKSTVVEDDDEVESVSEANAYAFFSQVEEEPLQDDSTAAPATTQEHPTDPSETTKSLHPVGTFSSLVVWGADVLPDRGQDEYIRTIDEWIRMADIIHAPDTDTEDETPVTSS